jgi:hypothetical protein
MHGRAGSSFTWRASSSKAPVCVTAICWLATVRFCRALMVLLGCRLCDERAWQPRRNLAPRSFLARKPRRRTLMRLAIRGREFSGERARRVEAIEAALGVKIPDDLAAFMQECANGRPKRGYYFDTRSEQTPPRRSGQLDGHKQGVVYEARPKKPRWISDAGLVV